jgi:folate-dependent phosphoribosylglycinamide formyltransferase PurN
MRIAVTSGYNASLHAIALLDRLHALGHQIPLCLQVTTLNWGRLRFLIRQIGWSRVLRTVLVKQLPPVAPTAAYGAEVLPMLDFLREHHIPNVGVRRTARRVGARMVQVSSLNSPKALKHLEEARVELVVYAGGGILRKDSIQRAGRGVVNAHGGPLPLFRGMNAIEWALLYGVRPEVSIHYIDTGIDTGPIFAKVRIPVDGRPIAGIRGMATRIGVEGLLETVRDIENGKQPAPQDPAEGRQVHVMADPLLEVVERWLREGRTPVRNAEDFRWDAAGGRQE